MTNEHRGTYTSLFENQTLIVPVLKQLEIAKLEKKKRKKKKERKGGVNDSDFRRNSYRTWSQCISSSVPLILPPFSFIVSVARPRGARHAWRMLYMWWSVIAVENGPVRALEIPAGCSRSSPDVRKLTSFQRELVKTWFFAWRTRWHADRRSIEPASEATRNLSGSGCDLVLRFHARQFYG